MTFKFIMEKESEERKREKRLVHMTNELGREFLESLKLKTRTEKDKTEFVAKSFLDYIFFEQHKEISEIHPDHIGHFLLEYAPRKLTRTKDTAQDIPEIIGRLVKFLNQSGHIKNLNPLLAALKDNTKTFLKLAGTLKKPAAGKEKMASSAAAKEPAGLELKVGRNDPCPCGSGKKYKKCCGLES